MNELINNGFTLNDIQNLPEDIRPSKNYKAQ